MSMMFKTVTKTWNPFTGCTFECYRGGCWAKRIAEGKQRPGGKYERGFTPTFHPQELNKRFSPGWLVFITSMGDISFATREQLLSILSRTRDFPDTFFLIQTKNPKQLYDWREDQGVYLPANVYFGSTIETNRDHGLSKAPPPVERFRYLAGYPHNLKFLSIEPLMDFDLEELVSWVKMIQPNIVEVGADNYNNHLPEPPWGKVEELLRELRKFCPRVVEKDRLERLKGGSRCH